MLQVETTKDSNRIAVVDEEAVWHVRVAYSNGGKQKLTVDPHD